MLTQRERDALDFIRRFQAENRGVSPNLQKIAEGLGLKSRSGSHKLLECLADRKFLRRSGSNNRIIELLPEPKADEIASSDDLKNAIYDLLENAMGGETLLGPEILEIAQAEVSRFAIRHGMIDL